MSNRRHSEFKKGFKADGARPSPGLDGVNSGSHMSESSPSKVPSYPRNGASGGVGYPPHGRKVKAHPQGSI